MKSIKMAIAIAIISAALAGGVSGTTYAAEKPTQKEAATKKEDKKPEPKVVEVQPGDTLTSIAEANGVDWPRLFNANEQIANPDSINPGDKITIPLPDAELPDRVSAVVAAQQQVVAQTATTYTTRSYSSAPVNSSSYYVGNGMWCTDYVQSKRSDVNGYGNAGYNWISKAQSQGKATGTAPQAGAVAVTNGHVAYVESVNADGSYVVSEMGWNYTAGNYNQRTVAPGTFGGFIY